MALPQVIRSATPDRVRNHPGLRALALAGGLIPPRVMHTPQEAAILSRLARSAQTVVELGVYEGSSALVFLAALPRGSELHLIDPFTDESGWAMRPGWRSVPAATRAVIRRARSGSGALVHWHLARSQDVGRRWTGAEVDLVFVDGDHSPDGVREDWEVWCPHVRPGGAMAFHDARLDEPSGWGSPGPTSVVNDLFRDRPRAGWRIVGEVDSLVVVQHAPG
jgi:MMP 1-O-methyltransferase